MFVLQQRQPISTLSHQFFNIIDNNELDKKLHLCGTGIMLMLPDVQEDAWGYEFELIRVGMTRTTFYGAIYFCKPNDPRHAALSQLASQRGTQSLQ